jgi:hypothetical protein
MLLCPPKNDFATVDELGIAIRNSDIQGVLHLGILYKSETETRLLHLTLNNARDELPTQEYCWVQCGLGDINRRVLAGLCADIAIKLVKGMFIPYGFSYNGQYFEPTGQYIGPQNHGLTCSTFIMAVFRTFGLELLATDEWPKAVGADQDFQKSMTEFFLVNSPGRVNDLIDQWGSPRFRPEHVAAASTVDKVPLGLKDATNLGNRIVRDFRRRPPVK